MCARAGVFVCVYACVFVNAEIEGWGLSPRGAGYMFGADVVEKVCAFRSVVHPWACQCVAVLASALWASCVCVCVCVRARAYMRACFRTVSYATDGLFGLGVCFGHHVLYCMFLLAFLSQPSPIPGTFTWFLGLVLFMCCMMVCSSTKSTASQPSRVRIS